MKRAVLLFALLAWTGFLVFGQTSKPEASITSEEQLKEFGYDPANVHKFLAELQKAVASNDKQLVSSMMDYPFDVVYRGRKHKIRSKSSFLSEYSQIFTPQVKSALAEQKPDQLFIKSTGFMIGRGEMWFDERPDGRFKVVTVQPK